VGFIPDCPLVIFTVQILTSKKAILRRDLIGEFVALSLKLCFWQLKVWQRFSPWLYWIILLFCKAI